MATRRHFPKERLQTTLGQWDGPHSTSQAAACMLTSLCPGKLSMQEKRRMVTGAAGAHGLLANRAPGKGGESVTILHPRTEVPRVRATECKPRHAEGSGHRLQLRQWMSLPELTTGYRPT